MMTSSNGNIFRVTGHVCGDENDFEAAIADISGELDQYFC